MTTLNQLGTLETIALERIISLCSAGSKLDWQALPKVFHGVIWKGVHKRRFTGVLKELRFTAKLRLLTIKIRALLPHSWDDDEYHFMADIGSWDDEYSYYIMSMITEDLI